MPQQLNPRIHLYYGPWMDGVGFDLGGKVAPPGALGGALNISNLDGSRNRGIFAYPQTHIPPPPIYTYMGTPFQEVRLAARTRIEADFSLGSTIPIQTVRRLLWHLFTIYADPTGAEITKPLFAKRNGTGEILIGNMQIFEKDFQLSSPELVNSLDRIKQEYTTLRNLSNGTDLPKDFHRRWLYHQTKKYKLRSGTDYRLIQGTNPDETPLPPQTTLTDNFNGYTDGALDGQGSWAGGNGANSIQVTSNQVEVHTSALHHSNILDSALSSADHYAQLLLVDGGTDESLGPATRVQETSWESYSLYAYNGTIYLREWNSTTFVTLDSKARTLGTNEVYKLQSEGTTHTAYIAGVEELSATDSTYSNLKTGMQAFGEATPEALADDFQASDDLSGGGGGGSGKSRVGINHCISL